MFILACFKCVFFFYVFLLHLLAKTAPCLRVCSLVIPATLCSHWLQHVSMVLSTCGSEVKMCPHKKIIRGFSCINATTKVHTCHFVAVFFSMQVLQTVGEMVQFLKCHFCHDMAKLTAKHCNKMKH